MKSLLLKLEQAEQGSRELDVAIWHLVETRFQRSEIMVGWSVVPRGNRTVKDDVFAPGYTTSLDAAMTLVPEGMGWGCVSNCGDAPATASCGSRGGLPQGANAATPALALCIASLKARA